MRLVEAQNLDRQLEFPNCQKAESLPFAELARMRHPQERLPSLRQSWSSQRYATWKIPDNLSSHCEVHHQLPVRPLFNCIDRFDQLLPTLDIFVLVQRVDMGTLPIGSLEILFAFLTSSTVLGGSIWGSRHSVVLGRLCSWFRLCGV